MNESADVEVAKPSSQGVTRKRIQIYGWDSPTETWSGPSELNPRRDSRLLASFRSVPGSSWYGRVNSATADQSARFFVLVHVVDDCAVALIYCDDSKNGPVEILVTIPSHGGAPLRSDFAFELVAFVRFLGGLAEDHALRVHDLIAAAIAETEPGDALVFAISTGLWTCDLDYVLSNCVERVATAALEWQAGN